MSKSKIQITPLGGLGEIGKNMTAVERDGKIVIIDVGLMFPTAEMLGIDLVLPDFTSLRERADDIEAIVLTHGHEDHVGALPYFLREIGMPPAIYGGPLTIGLVRSKLEEHRLKQAPLKVLEAGERAQAGPFEIETIHMSHSIPDARAVALHTDLGAILFTGDYRFDQTPVDGRPADFGRLAELGHEGVLVLCGDSTNADRPGVVPSESTVGPALLDVFSRCEGRIIVTCFASNVHRVQQVVDAAVELDRRVALVGRSMRKNFNIASNLGMAHAPSGLFIQPKEIENFPDHKVIAISTGSQGEPLSALRRMAHGDHRDVELHPDDTVIFSATSIPGNERAVNETVDKIYEIGARVITAADYPIHVSGHGSREELKLMINLTKPKYVFPFHGDYKRIHLHAEMAQDIGIEPKRIFKGKNGRTLEVDAEGARWGKEIESGMIFVDGVDIGDPDDVALRDRRTLSADGVLIVVVTVSPDGEGTVALPELIFRGVPFIEGEEQVELVEELRDVVADTVAEAGSDAARDPGLLQQDVHDDVAQFVYKRLKRRPMILPVVVEV
jgi:ribonuclease J